LCGAKLLEFLLEIMENIAFDGEYRIAEQPSVTNKDKEAAEGDRGAKGGGGGIGFEATWSG
jgi:hypothetical protein